MPPTINLDDLDPACVGVDHVANRAREADLRVAISNASASAATTPRS